MILLFFISSSHLYFGVFFNYSWTVDSSMMLKAWELTVQGDKEKLDSWYQGGYHETITWTKIKLHLTLALKQKYPKEDPPPPTDINLYLKGSPEPVPLSQSPWWYAPHCPLNRNFLLVSFTQRKPMFPFRWLEQLITTCFTTFIFNMSEVFPRAVLVPTSCLFSKHVVENSDVVFLVKAALKRSVTWSYHWGRGGRRWGDSGHASVKYLESFCVLLYLRGYTQKIILWIRILHAASWIGL